MDGDPGLQLLPALWDRPQWSQTFFHHRSWSPEEAALGLGLWVLTDYFWPK
jgi:hypothetical protein